MTDTARGLFSILQRDPHQAEAEAALTQLRKDIDEFHRIRLLNEMALRGTDKLCKFGPEEMRQRLVMFRDPTMEQRFKDEAIDLMRRIYRRDPTPEEVHAGIPGGQSLGSVSLFGIAAIVAGSAWGLHSITRYLTEREVMARGGSDGRPSVIWKMAKGAFFSGLLIGGGFMAWKGYGWAKDWWERREEIKELKGEIAELEEGIEEEEGEPELEVEPEPSETETEE